MVLLTFNQPNLDDPTPACPEIYSMVSLNATKISHHLYPRQPDTQMHHFEPIHFSLLNISIPQAHDNLKCIQSDLKNPHSLFKNNLNII